MNHDDLNLSHLLDTPAPPADGPERVRHTVARRRRRRQTIIGAASTFVLLVGGIGTTYALTDHDSDKVLLQHEASDNSPVTTTSTSTTSTTIPDPHQKYVGVEHDLQGAGLPLGTTIQTFGSATQATEYKVGDKIYTWSRDATGDMLWIERVTKVMSPTGEYVPMHAKVLAVFDIANVAKNHYMCLGWCAMNNKVDTSVIGLIDGSDGLDNLVMAWRVDVDDLTLEKIDVKGLKPFVEMPSEPPLPQRPDLYNYVVRTNTPEVWQDVTARESVSSQGAGGGLAFLLDTKENKDVAVLSDGGTGNVAVDVAPNGDFRVGGMKYKGESNDNVLIYFEREPQSNDAPKVLHAWLVDRATGVFNEVPISDIAL